MKTKKNILFISTGSLAFGESVMALNFARCLPEAQYQPCFIVSPLNSVLLGHDPHLESIQLFNKSAKINQLMVDDFLEHYPPDLIILCDFLTFGFSEADFGITLDYLRSYAAPIISLDSYEWESGDFVLDFFSGLEKQVPQTLLELDGSLRPCPVNKPAPPSDRHACYSFFHQIQPQPPDEVRRIRDDLEIAPEDFVILSATAVWQAFRPKEKYGGPFASIVSQLIEVYISALEAPLHWIRVGPDRERTTLQRGQITEHHFPSLPESRFDQLVAASDLLISTNLASTTLAKCIRYGRSALLLYNSVVANGPGDFVRYKHLSVRDATLRLIENAYPIHPFLMFPLGWYKFLSPVMKDNPYLGTFYQAEILDEEHVLALLRQAMSGTDERLQEQRDLYERLLRQTLPSPAECLEHFMRGSMAKARKADASDKEHDQ